METRELFMRGIWSGPKVIKRIIQNRLRSLERLQMCVRGECSQGHAGDGRDGRRGTSLRKEEEEDQEKKGEEKEDKERTRYMFKEDRQGYGNYRS